MSVAFDCSSDIAMFRKPYTTTSSMSFAFPPPTAIAGLVGSIVGLDNRASQDASNAAYWKAFKGTMVAVAIRNPVRWFRAAVNFWNVKNPQNSPHIQVKHQFLARPKYRIFIKNGIESRLREKLEQNSFIYTPFLGVAYALADVYYLGHFEDLPISPSEEISVNTVLPLEDDVSLDIAASGKVLKEVVPFKFGEDRTLIDSMTVLYSDTGECRIALKNRGAVDVTRSVSATRKIEQVVAWFPEW
ncbi:type I-B CRISPR-associated protein Cas5 [Synergistales bacterium]|nr:type I-B CRISPR-associated protein Cas5 [Synergistales bacterium]